MGDTVTLAVIDEPPFCFPGPDGQAFGYDVDVARAVLATMGVVELQTRFVAFADLISGVAAGLWRINTPLFVTPERQGLVSFSRGAWALGDGLLVRREDASRLTAYEVLALDDHARLAIVAGQVQEGSAAKAGVPPARILQCASPDEAVAAVRSGRADAYASVARAHRGFLARRPEPALAVVDIRSNDGCGGLRAIGSYSFAKHDQSFRDGFDAAFAGFLGSAEHHRFLVSHGFSAGEMVDWEVV